MPAAVKARPVHPADPPVLVALRPDRWTRPAPQHPGVQLADPTAAEAIGKVGGRRRRPKTSPSRPTYPTLHGSTRR